MSEEPTYEITPKGLNHMIGIPDDAMDTIQRWYDQRREALSGIKTANEIIEYLMGEISRIYVLSTEDDILEIAKNVVESVVPQDRDN